MNTESINAGLQAAFLHQKEQTWRQLIMIARHTSKETSPQRKQILGSTQIKAVYVASINAASPHRNGDAGRMHDSAAGKIAAAAQLFFAAILF
jgi:hypothetical protein